MEVDGMPGTIDTVPAMYISIEDIENLTEHLAEYHSIYSPLFYRREQREKSADYMKGLFINNIKRKSIEPMVLEMKGADTNEVRNMQLFISKGAWDDEIILKRHREEVDKSLGEDEGVIILDGSDFPKKGIHSVGVKRQYCGTLGKIENCQAGVFICYASSKGRTFLDHRLYMPEEWIKGEEFAERRRRYGVPEDLVFKKKQELGFDMIKSIVEEESLRARWLTCDEAFGRDTLFLDNVAGTGLLYFAEVPHDTRVWTERPEVAIPEWSGHGKKPTRVRVVSGAPKPQNVVEFFDSLPPDDWTRLTIKEGSDGPMTYDFRFLRVVAIREGLPGPDVWLVLRRDVLSGELKTFLSNAPIDSPPEALARVSCMRWPIETCFQEAKQHVGMKDYEIRTWKGWHHHMTMCILAYQFLVLLILGFKKSTFPDVATNGLLIVNGIVSTNIRSRVGY
jgi:SRSO17 transposase